MSGFYISKAPNYALAWALIKKSTAIKNEIRSLIPEAKINYAKAKAYEESCSCIPECDKPYHVYDRIKSLNIFSKDLRYKGERIKAWLDKRSWFTVTENGYTFEKAICSEKQKKFFADLRKQYKSFIDEFYPKGGDETMSNVVLDSKESVESEAKAEEIETMEIVDCFGEKHIVGVHNKPHHYVVIMRPDGSCYEQEVSDNFDLKDFESRLSNGYFVIHHE